MPVLQVDVKHWLAFKYFWQISTVLMHSDFRMCFNSFKILIHISFNLFKIFFVFGSIMFIFFIIKSSDYPNSLF